MVLSGPQKKQIYAALLSAYPQYQGLARMVAFELNESLPRIVPESDMEAVVFDLVQWAESSGCIQELVNGAHTDKPRNPRLSELVKAMANWFIDSKEVADEQKIAQDDEEKLKQLLPTKPATTKSKKVKPKQRIRKRIQVPWSLLISYKWFFMNAASFAVVWIIFWNGTTIFVSGIVIGAVSGLVQWIILWRNTSPLWWVLASAFGWGVGLSIGWYWIVARIVGWSALGHLGLVDSVVVYGIIVGAVVGLTQWSILRQPTSQVVWWVLASAASWGGGLNISWIVIEVVIESRFVDGIAGVIIAGFIGGFIAGGIQGATALQLWKLLQSQEGQIS